jgi:hypothetical protein
MQAVGRGMLSEMAPWYLSETGNVPHDAHDATSARCLLLMTALLPLACVYVGMLRVALWYAPPTRQGSSSWRP